MLSMWLNQVEGAYKRRWGWLVLPLLLLVGIARAQSAPVAGTAPILEAGTTSVVHTVQAGETLWSIAGKLLDNVTSWGLLQSSNKIKNPNMILPGSKIVVTQKVAASPVNVGAEVLEVSGPVWLKRGAEPQVKVERGLRVTAGDILATERGAFLSLALPDGSKVVMPSASGIQILDVSERVIRIKLLEGRVESYVEKMRANSVRQFELQMRSANLGVRGTHFRGRMEDGREMAEVINGVVVAEASSAAAKENLALSKAEGLVLTNGGNAWQKQALLPAPQLNQPAFGWQTATAETEPVRVLGMKGVEGARGYRVQLARDESFFKIFWESRTDKLNVALPTLEGGFAYVRVTAFDDNGLEGVPGDSLVYLPDNRTIPKASLTPLGAGQFALRWPGYPGQTFDVSLSRDAEFSYKMVDQLPVIGTGIVFGPLTVPGKYYWQVQVRESGKGVPEVQGPQNLFKGEFEFDQ